MKNIQLLEHALEFKPNLLRLIDLKPFGVDQSQLYIYCDHLNHPQLSGNKIRKLYGSLNDMQSKGFNTLITVGGNYSNYLYAIAELPEILNIECIVLIKGSEPRFDGYTIKTLKEKKVRIHFEPRIAFYSENLNQTIEKYSSLYPDAYFLPEGGANHLAHIGFEPLVSHLKELSSHLCISVGTQASYDALRHIAHHAKIYGYVAHSDQTLSAVEHLIYDYHFGGFAKITSELVKFVHKFREHTGILLDPIYTSKMIFGIIKDYQLNRLPPDQPVIAIHTGGIQGWEGMKEKYSVKN